RHDLQIHRGSRLASILPPETHPTTNSRHHQALLVDDACPGLVTALCPADGVPEALEIPRRRWVLGVQWHPEHLTDPELRAAHALSGAGARAPGCFPVAYPLHPRPVACPCPARGPGSGPVAAASGSRRACAGSEWRTD